MRPNYIHDYFAFCVPTSVKLPFFAHVGERTSLVSGPGDEATCAHMRPSTTNL